jgi:hypothetical protein
MAGSLPAGETVGDGAWLHRTRTVSLAFDAAWERVVHGLGNARGYRLLAVDDVEGAIQAECRGSRLSGVVDLMVTMGLDDYGRTLVQVHAKARPRILLPGDPSRSAVRALSFLDIPAK